MCQIIILKTEYQYNVEMYTNTCKCILFNIKPTQMTQFNTELFSKIFISPSGYQVSSIAISVV